MGAFSCFAINTGDSLTTYDSNHRALLIKSSYICVDDSNIYNIKDIIKKPFSSYKGGILNVGFISKNLWVKFYVKNNTSNEDLYIKIDQPVLESIELYEKISDTSFTGYELGEYKIFEDRFVKSPNYIFPIKVEEDSSKTFYLKIKSANPIQMPIYIGTRDAILEQTAKQEFFLGIYIGIVFIMIFYNAFIFISAKDVSYIYYIIFIIFIGLTQSVFKGYAFQFLWYNSPSLARESILIIPAVSGVYTGIFMQHFLQTKKYSPKLHLGINIFIAVYIVNFIIGLFDIQKGIIGLQFTSSLGVIYAIVIGYILARKGYRVALFFIFAYFVFLNALVLIASMKSLFKWA